MKNLITSLLIISIIFTVNISDDDNIKQKQISIYNQIINYIFNTK